MCASPDASREGEISPAIRDFIPLRQEDIATATVEELRRHLAGDWGALREILQPQRGKEAKRR
jgi:hypothetical protein